MATWVAGPGPQSSCWRRRGCSRGCAFGVPEPSPGSENSVCSLPASHFPQNKSATHAHRFLRDQRGKSKGALTPGSLAHGGGPKPSTGQASANSERGCREVSRSESSPSKLGCV